MSYERLLARLEAGADPTVSTLPDGSVDRFCRLSAGALDPVERRQTFAREVDAGGRKGFGLEPRRVEPGGQAVNAASQVAALGGETTCYGHLDHEVFDEVAFETVSMGEPATVDVLDFDDGDLLLVEASPDLPDWTLADLRAVADLESVVGADAVCGTNWVSVPGWEAAFHELGAASLPRRPFVFDPGDLLGSDVEQHRRFREALTALQATLDVVLSVNRTELRAMSAALPDPSAPPADDLDRLRALRAALGVAAVVEHATPTARAATGDGVVAVDNLGVESPARHTGGGDRFSGALAFALGADWDWSTALACGNAAASHYVATGETGDPPALRETVAQFG